MGESWPKPRVMEAQQPKSPDEERAENSEPATLFVIALGHRGWNATYCMRWRSAPRSFSYPVFIDWANLGGWENQA